MGTSPREQHAEHAKRILARRAKKTKGKANVEDSNEDIGAGGNGGDGDGACATTNEYVGASVADLRIALDGRGIKYKKKDTIAKLIEKLTA